MLSEFVKAPIGCRFVDCVDGVMIFEDCFAAMPEHRDQLCEMEGSTKTVSVWAAQICKEQRFTKANIGSLIDYCKGCAKENGRKLDAVFVWPHQAEVIRLLLKQEAA